MNTVQAATEIVETLTSKGFTAYFAGGFVRDLLLGHTSSDIDIATNATPEELIQTFPRTVLVGAQFGIIVVIHQGYHFEVATFRYDENYTDGRRPGKITYSNAQEDALRRDFTVNGMFYDPLKKEILDFVGGQQDLKLGLLRTIGSPKDRFNEDKLRLIRAVRFACKFHFKIEKETETAIYENAHLLFPSVSMERVWQELIKMNKEGSFDHALEELHRLKLLPTIFKDLKTLSLEEIKNRTKNLKYYPKECPTILSLMSLFTDLSLDHVLAIGKYLKVTNKDLKLLEFFWSSKFILLQEVTRMSQWEWAHFYTNPAATLCIDIHATDLSVDVKHTFLKMHAHQKHNLQHVIERIQQKRPIVTPAFLLKEKIPSGPVMGKLLLLAEQISINEDIHVAEEILHKLKRSSIWPSQELY